VLRIRDVYPGSRSLFIPDPTTAPKKEGEIYFVCPTIFCSHKYHKIVNNFTFDEQVKKIFFAKTIRIKVTFYPRVKKAPDPGSATQVLTT
jgi:hypothetical protein